MLFQMKQAGTLPPQYKDIMQKQEQFAKEIALIQKENQQIQGMIQKQEDLGRARRQLDISHHTSQH